MTPLLVGVLSVCTGAIAWTLTEYFLHRGLGHRKARNPFTVEHLAHHADTHYFAATKKKVVAVLIVFAIAAPLLYVCLGMRSVYGLAGFLAMYVMYEFVHRRLHTHAPKTGYGLWARRHHFYHHFKRPHKNHGVTSPVWDWVFGTLEVPGHVTVPKKHQVAWMRETQFTEEE